MKKHLLVFGTRPEAIKMIPIYLELLKNYKKENVFLCVTGQHDEMLYQVLDFFNVKVKTYMNPMSKWPIGGDQRPHADKEWADGSAAGQNYYDIGSVIYLNNDFEGGEVYFPQHDIELKPIAGSAVAFPGDMFFLHGVNEVKEKENCKVCS